MRKFIIERFEDEFYTSRSGLALVGLGVNRFTSICIADANECMQWIAG